ncbi:MAG: multidrug ABC transporter ATP-binding protein [Litorilinea sp.]|nr:MAG: multidrug ABC transporter ATP-binding protein [Litorilinea sp.]
MTAVIIARQLSRRFGHTLAVDALTLDVRQGEIFGFLGHNGAGKTTTVRLLNGLLPPSAGQVKVLGLDPVAEGPTLRRHTGVLTETTSLDERLSAWDNLTIYADLYAVPRRQVRARVEELLATFGLAGREHERVGSFSKGMKQRLALARALLHRPELLFLDEPAAGLDPVATRQLHELVLHLSRAEGCTVFLCTHNLAEAQKLCDRVAVLRQGRLLALGTPTELARQVVRGQRLEIETEAEALPTALAVLQGLPYVAEIHHNGDVLQLAGVERESVPGLVASLTREQVPIYRIMYQEPTLEDVYFALHDEAHGASEESP